MHPLFRHLQWLKFVTSGYPLAFWCACSATVGSTFNAILWFLVGGPTILCRNWWWNPWSIRRLKRLLSQGVVVQGRVSEISREQGSSRTCRAEYYEEMPPAVEEADEEDRCEATAATIITSRTTSTTTTTTVTNRRRWKTSNFTLDDPPPSFDRGDPIEILYHPDIPAWGHPLSVVHAQLYRLETTDATITIIARAILGTCVTISLCWWMLVVASNKSDDNNENNKNANDEEDALDMFFFMLNVLFSPFLAHHAKTHFDEHASTALAASVHVSLVNSSNNNNKNPQQDTFSFKTVCSWPIRAVWKIFHEVIVHPLVRRQLQKYKATSSTTASNTTSSCAMTAGAGVVHVKGKIVQKRAELVKAVYTVHIINNNDSNNDDDNDVHPYSKEYETDWFHRDRIGTNEKERTGAAPALAMEQEGSQHTDSKSIWSGAEQQEEHCWKNKDDELKHCYRVGDEIDILYLSSDCASGYPAEIIALHTHNVRHRDDDGGVLDICLEPLRFALGSLAWLFVVMVTVVIPVGLLFLFFLQPPPEQGFLSTLILQELTIVWLCLMSICIFFTLVVAMQMAVHTYGWMYRPSRPRETRELVLQPLV